jgi:hypothetical protein
MLAQPHTRQHLHLPSSHQLSSFDELSQQSAQTLFNQKLLHDYLEQQQTYANPVVIDSDLSADTNPFMTGAYDFSNPAIRIQQSTPTPQLSSSSFEPSSMLTTHNATGSGLDGWNTNTYTNNVQNNNQTLQTPRTSRTHQRAPSSSSIASNGSHYQTAPGYSYVAQSENLPSSSAPKVDSSYAADGASGPFSNHLPTPTHTPIQESFMNNNNYTNYNSNTMAAHLSMRQALLDQNAAEEEAPSFTNSARHSVSSYGHDSPATPHTAHGEDFDDRYKMPPSGETLPHKVDSWLFDEFLAYGDESDMRQQAVMPKFERTYTDAALDTFYDPSNMVPQSQPAAQAKPAPNTSLLSPYRSNNANDIVQRRLQAAQNARSQSPSSSVSRGVSPFRHNSPFRQPTTGYNSPCVRVSNTAAEAREQNIEADAAYALKPNVASSEEAQPKTISPKDALLDYREADEDSKMPLFPESGASEYGTQYSSGDQYRNATQSTFDTTTPAQDYRRDSWSTPQFSPSFATSTAASQSSTYSFAPPSMPGNLHGLQYSNPAVSHYRSTPTSMPSASDPPPDFPAHLTSMESSASEAEPLGSQNSQSQAERLQKPASSAADSGTYTCTYHGCTQRFETPQKLQKHKREGHRSTATATVGSSMTSAALLERNSQAGPHKCERINPTTGKPCNTIFSRPYDLTRHEDTIHNARKQKVRCALCVEDKTFSRNDALTRHMRVVHPEIDFPGKHRRRGGNHD